MYKPAMSGVMSALLGVWLCGAAGAAPVYKWVDGEGAVHFSDVPPPQGVPLVSTTHFDLPPPPPPGAEDYYSIRNQLQRLEAQRLALERDREQRRAEALRRRREELALEEQQRSLQERAQEDQDSPRYLLGYPYAPYYSGYSVRRAYRPWPGHRPVGPALIGRFPRLRQTHHARRVPAPADETRRARHPRPPPVGVAKGMARPGPGLGSPVPR